MPRQTTDHALWVAAINDFRSSGLTQPEFCRRRGLPLHSFRRRLDDRPTAATSPTVGPVPAALVSPDTTRFLPVKVIALDDRIRTAVSSGFDPETLRRLLDALGTQP